VCICHALPPWPREIEEFGLPFYPGGMPTTARRRSRWVAPKRHVNLTHGDLEICKLLTPYAPVRYPWSYTYLPTRYFAPLLETGPDYTPNRLAQLRAEGYVTLPDQPRSNFRDLIYQLGKAGAAEVRELGYQFDITPRALAHELGSCLVAANVELGARKYNLPLDIVSISSLPQRPDWPIFTLASHTVMIEFDTGSESQNIIEGKYHCYLDLIERRRVQKPIFLFITTKRDRVNNLINTLKILIDRHELPYSYAQYFAFGHMTYDRFLNKLPELSGGVITHAFERAGHEPFTFHQV
jgi:hypothetical protein